MMRALSDKGPLLAAIAGLAALLVFASLATASTLAEKTAYKEQVEPICKTNKQASDRLLKPVRSLVKKNKLKQAGTAFSKAAKALEKAQKQLAKVPQPPSDSAKLNKWLSEIKSEVSLMRKIAKEFKKNTKAGKSKATSLAVTLQNNANKANNGVVAFGFNYCKINPSSY